MDLSKENRISQLLGETARCGLREASPRDVAIDYCTHDSDRVFLGLLESGPGPPHFRYYKDTICTAIMYNGQTNSNMLNVTYWWGVSPHLLGY